MKTFIVDTNVLINDPYAFQSFGEGNHVIIPLIVIQELDGLKTRKSGAGASARAATRAIDALRKDGAKLHEGVDLDNGGRLTVSADIHEPKFPIVGTKNADHYILQMAIENSDAILVTEDTALRIQADALGVRVERYENSLVEPASLYQRTSDITLSSEDLSYLQAGNETHLTDDLIRMLDGERYACYRPEYSSNSYLFRASYEAGTLEMIDFNYEASKIKPRNLEQTFAMDALLDPNIEMVALAGQAGTGKTLLAMAAGLEQTLESGARYDKMTIARPIVPMGNELGFLPGTLDEKLNPWMGSIHDSMDRIMRTPKKRGDRAPISTLELLKDQGFIEVQALQYIRGRSLPKQFVLIDEAQQLTPHEIQTIATRAGEGTKLVFCGDPYQIDSPYLDLYNNGMSFLIDRFKGKDIFASVTLHKGERSRLAEMAAKLLG